MIELVADILASPEVPGTPQLVIRPHPLSAQRALDAITEKYPNAVCVSGLPDLYTTPTPDDTAFFTSLLRHASLGINGASTISIELMIHDKPVINLGFDPPGAELPRALRYERHLTFDHFQPVVASGAVMVARSPQDMEEMIIDGLANPDRTKEQRRTFLRQMFGDKLDAHSGRRVAESVLTQLDSSATRIKVA